MQNRINYVLLLVGKRGTGKTTQGIAIANSTKKPILVINTDNNDSYNSFKVFGVDEIKKQIIENVICVTEEPIRAIEYANKFQKNITVILDDTQKYISQTVQSELQRLIINNRMNNIDLILMYHNLKFVPPYVAMNFNKLVLFKTVPTNENEVKNKFAQSEILIKKMHLVNSNKNNYYCTIINDNE